MGKEECIKLLKKYMGILKNEYGITSLSLFGSTARGEQTEQSDIDLFVDTQTPNPFLLQDAKEFLEKETGTSVDIIRKDILEDILSAIDRLEDRTKDVQTTDDFLSSSSGMVLLDATCMLLIAIGESLKNLDKNTDGKLLPTYPSIPWKNVKGMRDIIAHHYFDVDASQILWIIKNEIAPLKVAIQFFISELNK